MMYPAAEHTTAMNGPHPAIRKLQDGVRKVIASDTALLLNRYRENKSKAEKEKAEKAASERRLDAAARIEAERHERQRIIKEIFHKEPCPYGHPVFQYAAQIFAVLEHGPRSDNPTLWKHQEFMQKQKIQEIPEFEFDSDTEKRLTFNLVFSTLKYQRFLEDMLEDCSFFSQYPEFREDSAVVMVILCDYQQRKFQLRTIQKEEILDPHLTEIESAIYKCKTKLNAALARSRIKSGVLSIDHLLPESVRSNDKIGSSMHVFAWVNQIKTDLSSVEEELSADGFTAVELPDTLIEKQYSQDYHCPNLLVFAAEQREYLEQHFLIESGHLVIQDKSSCVGPHSAKSLINEGDDIMHINIGSSLTTAHLASLTHGSDSVIYGFGIESDKHHKQVMANLEKLGAKAHVRIIPEDFLDTDLHDERLKHIKVVLVTSDCSRSGVANPVNFIVNEGEDMIILKSLSLGRPSDSQLSELMVKHSSILKHALKFPRVQALVYTTRSLFEDENENVIMRSLEYINTTQQKKTPFRVAPPVIPLSQKDIESENPLVGKYLRFMPSNHMSGCFIAAVTREADDPKEAAKDILARAAARGIITGVPTVKDRDKSKGRGRKKSKDKAARKKSPPRSPKIPMEIQQEAGGGAAVPPGVVSSIGLREIHVATPTRLHAFSTPGMALTNLMFDGKGTSPNAHAVTPCNSRLFNPTPFANPTQENACLTNCYDASGLSYIYPDAVCLENLSHSHTRTRSLLPNLPSDSSSRFYEKTSFVNMNARVAHETAFTFNISDVAIQAGAFPARSTSRSVNSPSHKKLNSRRADTKPEKPEFIAPHQQVIKHPSPFK